MPPTYGENKLLGIPGEIRNRIYEICTEDQIHVEMTPRLDLAYQSFVQVTDDASIVAAPTEEPQFDDWHVQERKYLGLTQVNRQIRCEFLPIHSQNVGVTLNESHYEDCIAIAYPSTDIEISQSYRGTIVVGQPDSPNDFVVDILPLMRLAERAPALKIYQRVYKYTYLKIDEHTYLCATLWGKTMARDTFKSVDLDNWDECLIFRAKGSRTWSKFGYRHPDDSEAIEINPETDNDRADDEYNVVDLSKMLTTNNGAGSSELVTDIWAAGSI
ncbi:hypothetical protein K491DRAFT_685458 [Lophiostoma macrostomum CBS 122681]|uniref:Uncharacterized protein n=1 Tax=Lophiostoma macrostomum CBS 122681 TaxID=1314788 RepID=A0A6A6SMW0_9PLEO|nr:hypothetical protein K491DRAFT_685458 [Lophiostoma macrostomum CBS 122681]